MTATTHTDATVTNLEALTKVVETLRKTHSCCPTEPGACPWPNFTEYELTELAQELAAAGYVVVKAEPCVRGDEYDWSTRDSSGIGWEAANERRARDRIKNCPDYTLWRRRRYVLKWEQVDA